MLYIFDCDGVLVDSEVIAAKVDSVHFAEAGYEISPEEVTRRFAGLTSRVIMDIVSAEIGHPLPDDFFEKTKREIDRRLATELNAVLGVEDLLDRIEGPRAIASNSTSERLKISLERTQLYDRFKPYIFSAVEVADKRPKPAPDVYIYAMKQFDADPRETLIIEDSVFGVKAAKASGARVVGFTGASHTWPGHGELLTDAGAETVIRRLADLPKVAEAFMAWEGITD